MPVEVCSINGTPGFRWGARGRCYVYDPTDPESESVAREAAQAQGRAARSHGYGATLNGSHASVAGRSAWVGAVALMKADAPIPSRGLTAKRALELLREVELEASAAADAAWQATVGTAVRRVTSSKLTTSEKVRAAVASVQKEIREFLASKEFKEGLEDIAVASYSYGVLSIWERYKEIEARDRTPAPVAVIRPDGVKKAKTSAWASVTGAVNLTLEDDVTIRNRFAPAAQAWVSGAAGEKYAGRQTSEALEKHVSELLKTGLSADKIAEKVKAEFEARFAVGTFDGRGLTYWGGVVEHVATTAGVIGQITEAGRLGFTRYELVNPMDERTTPCCSMMNGKVFFVSDGASLISNMLGAKTPEEVKTVKPFVSGGKPTAITSVVAMTPGPSTLTAKDSKALSEAGFALPPFHFRCRTYVDVFYEEGSPPVPVVQPIPPAERVPLEPSPPVGFPYKLDDCKVHPLKLGGNNPKFVVEAPDGSLWMHKDYTEMASEYRAAVDELAAVVQAAAGVPVPPTHSVTFGAEWKGWGEGQRARKSMGSITRLFSKEEVSAFDIGGATRGINIETLAAAQIRDVQIDHAVNWLISNGDAHYENFILLKNGRVVGIDKGQGFKFFGRDRLEWDYVSPQAPYPSTNGYAYAESQLTRYANGQMPKNFGLEGVYDSKGELTEFGQALRRMQNFSDEEYKRILKPYADAMVRDRRGVFADGLEKGFEKVLGRKNSLVKDYDEFYSKLEARRREVLGITNLSPEERLLAQRNLWANGEEILKATEAAKGAGYTVITGSSALEDMILHGTRYTRKGGGSAQYQFRGRLRPVASASVKKTLQGLVSDSPSSLPAATAVKSEATLLAEARARIEAFWDPPGQTGAFRFIKSFNARFDAAEAHSLFGTPLGKYEAEYDKMIAKFTDLASLKTPAQRLAAEVRLGYLPSATEVGIAEDYLELLWPFRRPDGTWNVDHVKSKIGALVQPPTPATINLTPRPILATVPAPVPAQVPKSGPKVRKMTADEGTLEHLSSGPNGPVIESEFGTAASKRGIDVQGGSEGGLYTFRNADGFVIEHGSNPSVSIRYYGPESQTHLFRNDIRVIIDKASPTAKDLIDARELLSKIGVDLKPEGAALDEMRILWARKQARVAGLELDATTKNLFAISEDISPAEQLRQIEKAFDAAAAKTGNQRFKWDTLTKGMKDEDFLPKFDSRTPLADGTQTGFPSWTRRDLTVKDLADAGVEGAFSSITGNSTSSLVKILADSENAAFLSTAQRARAGVPWSNGMSARRDMETGGANYVFTRVNAGGLHGAKGVSKIAEKIDSGAFAPATQRSGLSEGVYWKKEALLNSDGIFYARDLFGQVDSTEYINSHMVKTITAAENPGKTIASKMLASDNEFIPKHELGLNKNIDFWVVSSFDERTKCIEAMRANGVTELGGRPIEKVFLVSGY